MSRRPVRKIAEKRPFFDRWGNPDVLHLYMDDTDRYSLFASAEEEKDFLRGYSSLSPEEREKKEKILIESNLRFVWQIAGEYSRERLTLMDLIQAGNEGLITAAKRFNEHRGVKFISYAVWWVRREIREELKRMAFIHVKERKKEILRDFHEKKRQLEEEQLRKVSTGEVCFELGISEEEITSILNVQTVISLDRLVDPENARSGDVLDTLGDESHLRADDGFLEEDVHQALVILEETYPREANVLRLYFGIGVEKPHTLEVIGQTLGLTRERVRQMKEKGLRILRRSGKYLKLAEYR